jgi:hypothetical protein
MKGRRAVCLLGGKHSNFPTYSQSVSSYRRSESCAIFRLEQFIFDQVSMKDSADRHSSFYSSGQCASPSLSTENTGKRLKSALGPAVVLKSSDYPLTCFITMADQTRQVLVKEQRTFQPY